MKKFIYFVFTGAIFLSLCGASCNTVPMAEESNVFDAGITPDSPGGETDGVATLDGEDNAKDTGLIKVELEIRHEDEEVPQADSSGISQDSAELFLQSLTGLEIIRVYPSISTDRFQFLTLMVNIRNSEIWDPARRYYFFYNSPLRPMPISSTDQLIDSAQAKAKVVRETGPIYKISLNIAIDDANDPPKIYNFTIHRGLRILDYRQEAVLRYTVMTEDGYAYGECIFASALLVRDEEMSGAFVAVKAFLEQMGEMDISDLLYHLENLERRQ
jgi:hypothetical protein